MLDTSFHTVKTNSPEFHEMVLRGQGVFEAFKQFAEMETEKAGRLSKGSNKAGSYYNFLVRLTIGIEANTKVQITNLGSFDTYLIYEQFMKQSSMQKFNRDTHNFYSAAVSCYLRFVSQFQKVEENIEDMELNLKLVDYVEEESVEYHESRAPKVLAKPVKKGQTLVYPRDIRVSYAAKVKANWQCEFNYHHATFITPADNRPYMEAHHLIPMATQPYFQYSIDFVDNVVCLCPNCHRRIHCACRDEKAEIIDHLYATRKDYYADYKIEVDQKKLYGFYGIE